MKIWGKNMNNLIKKGLVVAVILLFLGLAFAPSIPALKQKTIEDKEFKPIKFPFYIYSAKAGVKIENISGLITPIPPGEWVSIPLIIEYWNNIPQRLKALPWPLITLWLFFSFHFSMQKIWLEITDVSDDIDIVFSENQLYTPIIYDGEQTNISISMYICVGENTPCGNYTMYLTSYCNDVGRINGDNLTRTIKFVVGY